MFSDNKRKEALEKEFIKRFGNEKHEFIVSPGRIELIGNHTDHQGGHVVACAIDVDNLFCFGKNDDNTVKIIDSKLGYIEASLNEIEIIEEEYGTSKSLIKGIAKAVIDKGYKIGGFCGICNSNVLPGSGISSSACFELMICECFNHLYCNDELDALTKAKIGQYAENVFFGKPCGLMDQLAIAAGGVLAIDFKNEPEYESLDFSFSDYGYSMLLVNVKADHKDLTSDYAAITREMKSVCKAIGISKLSEIDAETFYGRIPEIRNSIKNDRAILRAIHYFEEDKRAIEFASAVKEKDVKRCLTLMNASGDSSFEFLQNIYSQAQQDYQPLALAIALSKRVLNGKGAVRVHGGGFAGTILAVVPNDILDEYKSCLEAVFGSDSILMANIRK